MSILKGCKPRRDVLHGDRDDAIFAADFGSLIAGDRCPEVYRDAGKFFANTHPAAQLKKVVQVVFGRLADTKEPGALGEGHVWQRQPVRPPCCGPQDVRYARSFAAVIQIMER